MTRNRTSPAPFGLDLAPLDPEAFAPFGEVVQMPAGGGRPINRGTAIAVADAVALDLVRAGGRPSLQLLRARPVALPARLGPLERHLLSSQTFLPLGEARFAVVVAPADAAGPGDLRAFLTDGQQGVHYAAGTWHHPLIALGRISDFVVIGRAADAEDCEFLDLPGAVLLTRTSLMPEA